MRLPIFKKITEDSLRQATIPSVIGENMGWYLALSGTLPENPMYDSYAFTLLINQILYGETGILYINIRKDIDNVYVSQFKWLSNTGLSSECFKINVVGRTFNLYVKTTGNYQRYQLRVLQEHNIDGITLDLKHNLFSFNNVKYTDTVEEPDGIKPSQIINHISGSAQPTGETFYGVPIYKVYVEGNMPTNGNSNIILYNCKQILSHDIYVNLPSTESWFSLNNDGIGGIGHSAQYDEVRIYASNSGYDNATFKGFITYIQS